MGKSLFSKRVIRVFILILGALSVFLILLKVPTDPDLGWHLRNGEIIVREHRLPRADEFSHTFAGYRWADSYWLTEVLLFLGKQALGLAGLSFLFALLAAFAFFLQSEAPQSLGEVGAAVAAASAGALLAAASAGVRPQVVSLFLFSIVWFLLRKERYLWVLPFLFLLWANLHAAFVIGLGLFWLFVLLNRNFRLLPVGLFSTVVTLLNPYGLFLHTTIFKDVFSPLVKNRILEWQSPDFHNELGLVFLFYLAVLFFFLLRRRGVLDTEVVLILVFVFFSFTAIRHLPLLAVLATPFLARQFAELRPPRILRPSIYYHGLGFLLLFPLLWGLTIVPKVVLSAADSSFLAEEASWPHAAVEFLQNNPQDGNLFNDYAWGGYLIWQLPQAKVFIDGRMPGWSQDGKSAFADYLTVTQLKPGWEEVLQKYSISYFLIRSDSALSQALRVHPGWEVIYEDETAAIFGQEINAQSKPVTPADRSKFWYN